LDQKAIHDLVPGLADRFEVGVFQPQHGYVADPQSLVQRIVGHFTTCGGELLTGRAARVEPQSDVLTVRLEDGRRLDADRIVIAAGAWSKALLTGLGVS